MQLCFQFDSKKIKTNHSQSHPLCEMIDQKKYQLLKNLYSLKTTYKRLPLSPIRYAGGKSLAVGHVIQHLPKVQRVISPFFGGGSIEIALEQKLGIPIVASDINPTLVNYWKFQIHNPQALYRELKQLEPTKEQYQSIRKLLKEWRNHKKKLNKLQQAVYFFFNHNLSYGPSFIGWASRLYLNPKKYQKMIEKVRDFQSNIKITCEPFQNLFQRYPNDFFYCDPPYFLKTHDQTSQMFNGIYPERNHPHFHDSFDHERLKDLIHKHPGGFILSYNDCQKSREYYRHYQIESPSWQYTMGQGETRISNTLKNRNIDHQNAHIKKSHELLITQSHVHQCLFVCR